MTRALPPVEYYEVRVEGALRGVRFERGEADRLARDIAETELVDVAVLPVRGAS